MGLDITAYEKLVPASDEEREHHAKCGDFLDWQNHVYLFTNEDFPGRDAGAPEGAYRVEGKRFRFAAGSYTGYGHWREQLARMAGYPKGTHRSPLDSLDRERHAVGAWQAGSGPFWELICFADNEGTLGPVVAKKLHADFVAHRDKAVAFEDDDLPGWFLEKYDEWTRALELASGPHGAVKFH